MIEQFIGEKVIVRWYNRDEKTVKKEYKGILLFTTIQNDHFYVLLFEDNGEIRKYYVGDDCAVYVENHDSIRQKILNTPKPKMITREELIDLEE